MSFRWECTCWPDWVQRSGCNKWYPTAFRSPSCSWNPTWSSWQHGRLNCGDWVMIVFTRWCDFTCNFGFSGWDCGDVALGVFISWNCSWFSTIIIGRCRSFRRTLRFVLSYGCSWVAMRVRRGFGIWNCLLKRSTFRRGTWSHLSFWVCFW